MSKYTRELRWIVEGEKQFPPPSNVLSLTKVLSDYKIYNEIYNDTILNEEQNRRTNLNEKIIEHFYFREIGFDTTNRFLFALKRRLNEIMPLYNQRYKSADFEYNPLYNIELHETFTQEIQGVGSSTSSSDLSNTENDTNTLNSTVNSTNIESGSNDLTSTQTIESSSTNEDLGVTSNTPNQELTEADIKLNKWASNTQYDKTSNDNNSTNTNTSSQTNENEITTTNTNSSSQTGSKTTTQEIDNTVNSSDSRTETYTKTTEGSSAGLGFSRAIEQWREVMINIDMEIINDLEDLFMGVW